MQTENIPISRSARFLAGITAGYANILANILYALASIPIALHYLPKEEFGLWALALQITGYLKFLEFGMSDAVYRHIADHINAEDRSQFGTYMSTSAIAYTVQGAIIVCCGLMLYFFADSLFAIPRQLSKDFSNILLLVSLVIGISVSIKTLGAPLWAYQRMDVIQYGYTISTTLSLCILWLSLANDVGIYSFVIALAPSPFIMALTHYFVCARNRYYPAWGDWRRPTIRIWKQLFGMGRDAFLIQVGLQIVNASQIIVLARCVGLGAAATYAVASKVYALGLIVLANPISAAGPGLTDLLNRGQHERFKTRGQQLIIITLSCSSVISIGIAAANRAFVNLWTGNEITWSWKCDILLAILLILKSHNAGRLTFFGITKRFHKIRWLYLTEAIGFLSLSIPMAGLLQIEGVLLAAIISNIATTTPILSSLGREILGIHSGMRKKLLFILLMISAAATTNAVSYKYNLGSGLTLIISACLLGGLTCAIWALILNNDLRQEISARARALFTKILILRQ